MTFVEDDNSLIEGLEEGAPQKSFGDWRYSDAPRYVSAPLTVVELESQLEQERLNG